MAWFMGIKLKEDFKICDDPVLIKKKNEMRAALREEYIRKAANPHRCAMGIGGQPFDAMHERYYAALRSQDKFFRSTPRATILGAGVLIILPICFYLGIEKLDREPRERALRQGMVPYEKRYWKWV